MVTTIGSQKGGVAKTTTCLSLGACLAEMGHSVLLVDLDPQAHLTLSMGIRPEKLSRTVGDAPLANASLLSVSRESSISGLDVVPALCAPHPRCSTVPRAGSRVDKSWLIKT